MVGIGLRCTRIVFNQSQVSICELFEGVRLISSFSGSYSSIGPVLQTSGPVNQSCSINERSVSPLASISLLTRLPSMSYTDLFLPVLTYSFLKMHFRTLNAGTRPAQMARESTPCLSFGLDHVSIYAQIKAAVLVHTFVSLFVGLSVNVCIWLQVPLSLSLRPRAHTRLGYCVYIDS